MMDYASHVTQPRLVKIEIVLEENEWVARQSASGFEIQKTKSGWEQVQPFKLVELDVVNKPKIAMQLPGIVLNNQYHLPVLLPFEDGPKIMAVYYEHVSLITTYQRRQDRRLSKKKIKRIKKGRK